MGKDGPSHNGFFLASQRIHELVEKALNKLAKSLDQSLNDEASTSESNVRVINGCEYKLEAVVGLFQQFLKLICVRY
jgi:hypothetical protein